MVQEIAAGIVVFEPELPLLQTLVEALLIPGEVSLILFVNGVQADPVESYLTAIAGRTHILRVPQNVGLGGALNAVMHYAATAGHRHVFLLDQDSTPATDLITNLSMRAAALARSHRKIAAIAPRLTTPRGSTFLPIDYHRSSVSRHEPEGAVDFLPTSGTLVDVGAWHAIGPFRADFFIGSIDVEWGHRARAGGWHLLLIEDLEMVHRWGHEATGSKHTSQFLRQSCNRILYYFRNSINCLRLPHMSGRWKRWQLARLAVQVPLTLMLRRDVSARRLYKALSDGWTGRLGPL